jgi:DNA-binding protein H-NS
MLMKTLQPFDWAAMSIDEMSKLHTEVQTALSQRIIARIDELQARLERLSVPAKDVKAKRFYPEVRPKYRDPATRRTWSGRGKTPRWLKGKNPDDYRIQA